LIEKSLIYSKKDKTDLSHKQGKSSISKKGDEPEKWIALHYWDEAPDDLAAGKPAKRESMNERKRPLVRGGSELVDTPAFPIPGNNL
jgi:hypothetical protein